MSDYDQIESMSREQLLSELQNIPYWAYLTALPTEMCLEVQIFTREGYRCNWIGYDDWTLFMFESINKDEWHRIEEKVKQGELFLRDLDGTDLYSVTSNHFSGRSDDENIAWFFSEMRNIGELPEDGLFCYFDPDNEKDKLHFFISEEGIVNYLAGRTIIDNEWTSMTDEELESYLDFYRYAGPSIPYYSIG